MNELKLLKEYESSMVALRVLLTWEQVCLEALLEQHFADKNTRKETYLLHA